MINHQFIRNVKQRMLELDVGPDYLALMSGMSDIIIQEILSGQRRPMGRTVRRFAIVLETKPHELWPGFNYDAS